MTMIKTTIALLALWCCASCFAAVDLNRATVAELDGIKGIGPAMSRAILSERQKGPFKSWKDFTERVKGVREATAIKYSNAGLTINGEIFVGFNPPAATKDTKAEAREKAEEAEGAKVLQQAQQLMGKPATDVPPALKK